jgi:serine/threonine-protein kinase
VATSVAEGVRKVSLASSASTPVAATSNAVFGGTWTVRDEIVYAVPETGLWRVPAAGGTPQRIAQGRFWYPDGLPDGRHVVATLDNPTARTSDDFRIALVNIDTGAVRTLVEGGTYVRYAASGHLVYLRDGSLLAVAFDTSRLTVEGAPVAVVSGVFMNPSIASGNFAISPTGTLAYAAGDGSEFRRTLVAVDPDGTKSPLTDDRRNYASPRVSPDGTRIAVTADAVRGAALVLDIARSVLSRITPDEYDATRPIWTPDGRSLVVAASKEGEPRGLFLIRAEAGAPMQRLTSSDLPQVPYSWTPDGKTLVFGETRAETSADLWTLTLDGDRTPRPLLQTRDAEQEAAVSPDGRSIAYAANRSGLIVVYVADFPALTNTVQASTGYARLPVWSRDGRRLFFKESGSVIDAVAISRAGSHAALTVSKPQRIVEGPSAPLGPYDVTPDGRFVVVDGEAVAGAVSELKIVLNWFTELRAKLPPR